MHTTYLSKTWIYVLFFIAWRPKLLFRWFLWSAKSWWVRLQWDIPKLRKLPDYFQASSDPKQRVETFVEFLSQQKDEGFQHFIDSLTDTNQAHVISFIETTSSLLNGKFTNIYICTLAVFSVCCRQNLDAFNQIVQSATLPLRANTQLQNQSGCLPIKWLIGYTPTKTQLGITWLGITQAANPEVEWFQTLADQIDNFLYILV
jgi:hypothetical protein